MNSMPAVKRACICALCIALCYVLPLAFHALGAAQGGSAFSPMHIPVLLCGLLCGWPFGLFCGIAGPVLSSALSGMPPATSLISMLPELAVYGFASGLLMRLLRTGSTTADLYLSMLPAMLLGRVAGGVAKALFYLGTREAYSLSIWAAAYFVETLPGTVIQLVLLPSLALLLMKARLVPQRYPDVKGKRHETE